MNLPAKDSRTFFCLRSLMCGRLAVAFMFTELVISLVATTEETARGHVFPKGGLWFQTHVYLLFSFGNCQDKLEAHLLPAPSN